MARVYRIKNLNLPFLITYFNINNGLKTMTIEVQNTAIYGEFIATIQCRLIVYWYGRFKFLTFIKEVIYGKRKNSTHNRRFKWHW